MGWLLLKLFDPSVVDWLKLLYFLSIQCLLPVGLLFQLLWILGQLFSNNLRFHRGYFLLKKGIRWYLWGLLKNGLLSIFKLPGFLFVNFVDFSFVLFQFFFQLIFYLFSFLLINFLRFFLFFLHPVLKVSLLLFFDWFFILSYFFLSFSLQFLLLIGHFFDIGFFLFLKFLRKASPWLVFFGFKVFLDFILFGFVFLFNCCFLVIVLFAFLFLKLFLLFFPLHFD